MQNVESTPIGGSESQQTRRRIELGVLPRLVSVELLELRAFKNHLSYLLLDSVASVIPEIETISITVEECQFSVMEYLWGDGEWCRRVGIGTYVIQEDSLLLTIYAALDLVFPEPTEYVAPAFFRHMDNRRTNAKNT